MKLTADKSFLRGSEMINRETIFDSKTDEEAAILIDTKLAHQTYETKVVVPFVQEEIKIAEPIVIETKEEEPVIVETKEEETKPSVTFIDKRYKVKDEPKGLEQAEKEFAAKTIKTRGKSKKFQ